MRHVIQIPLLGARYHEACSPDSALRPRRSCLFSGRRRSPHPRIQAECVHAAATCRRSDTRYRALEPSGQVIPRSGKFPLSTICLHGLALLSFIMDDKSMQSWTNALLTPTVDPRTIVLVSRPTKPASPASYKAAFFKRVRAARMRFTENPPEMAKALGVPRDTYYRYEERTMLPHHLIPRFCELCDVTVDWLMLGPSASRPAHAENRSPDREPS